MRLPRLRFFILTGAVLVLCLDAYLLRAGFSGLNTLASAPANTPIMVSGPLAGDLCAHSSRTAPTDETADSQQAELDPWWLSGWRPSQCRPAFAEIEFLLAPAHQGYRTYTALFARCAPVVDTQGRGSRCTAEAVSVLHRQPLEYGLRVRRA